MMDLLSRFKAFISEQQLFSGADRLLLAVSGGVDSVVLCELCAESGFDFDIAHANFMLRGVESERDERFVHGLAEKYQKKILVRRFDTESYAREKKCSIQVAARELRYSWFDELTQSENAAQYILTAHHLDDNVETVLMNFFKGTGIAGLHGILPRQGKLVRPLLFARKNELAEFAKSHLLDWVEDSSNATGKYSRNFLRRHIIPEIEKQYPQLAENISSNIGRFRDVELLYRESVFAHKKKLLEERGAEFHIPVLKLKKTKALRSISYEIIRDFGFGTAETGEFIRLLDSDTGKYIQSATHRILKNRQWLIISPLRQDNPGIVLVEEDDASADFEMGQLILKKNEVVPGGPLKISASPSVACLDAAHIQYPLILRKWKLGDYFYPLGMRKKKKIARFLIDQKLSAYEKEKTWVIESNKKIIWVVGLRIDDRHKITPSTKKILSLEIHPR